MTLNNCPDEDDYYNQEVYDDGELLDECDDYCGC
jgi:hypothetical protein